MPTPRVKVIGHSGEDRRIGIIGPRGRANDAGMDALNRLAGCRSID